MMEIKPEDCRWESFRAAGNMHVARIESSVRLVHLPTGIVIEVNDSRVQFENREKALELLQEKLNEL